MKTNVNLEFINGVRELSEKMLDLASFWLENQEALEDANVSKNYPFNKSFDDLALDTRKWFIALINDYNEYLQK